jgi:translation initiation factor 1
MAKKRAPIEPVTASLSSLGDLLRQRGVAVDDAPAHQPQEAPLPSLELSPTQKIVLRRERKGHGGKTVTIVERVELDGDQLEELARRLRKALGTGARVDGGRVIVQGDVGDAAEAWLRAQGVRRVTRGN